MAVKTKTKPRRVATKNIGGSPKCVAAKPQLEEHILQAIENDPTLLMELNDSLDDDREVEWKRKRR